MAEGDNKKTAAELARELNLLQEHKDLVESIKKLTEEQLESLKDHSDVSEKVNLAIKQQLANLEKSLDYHQRQVEAAETYLKSVNKLGNTLDENNLKREAEINYERTIMRHLQEQIRLNEGNSVELSKQLKIHKENLEQLERQASAAGTLQSHIDRTRIANSKLMGSLRIGMMALKDGPGTTFRLFSSLAAGPVFGQLKKGFGMLKKSVIDVMFAVDNATHAFQRQTGMGEKYNAGMKQNYLETRRFGATMEDVSKQTQTLIGTVSDFSLESAQAGTRVAQTGVLLEKLGVQGEDFAKGIQNSMKMFGQSMMQGEQTALELLETSKALGIEPKKLAGDYAKMGGQLAKLGRDGPQAFKELARVSKITGMEMEKILAVTNKFDTFESAAEMTGKLNAALGGNFVNAMDMMMDTDPVSRFEKMRDAISQTGLTFDDMSYYQKQFYAESMGLSDVGDLALMMSGNMDMMSGATQKSAADYEKLAEEAQATMSLQEKFNSFLAQVAPILEDLMDQAHKWMDSLQENDTLIANITFTVKTFAGILLTLAKNFEIVLGVLIGAPLIMAGVSFAMKLMTLQTNKQIAANLKEIAQAPAHNAAIRSKGKSAIVSGNMMKKGSVGVGAFALKMLAVGAAIGMITGGIGYMANGLANMFNSISGEKIAIFTAFMSQIGQGAVLATVHLSPLAAMFAEIAVELDKVDGGKLDKLTNIGKGFEASGGEALSTILTQIAGAMAEIPAEKAGALTATMSAANLAAKSAEILIGRVGEKKSTTVPSSASGAGALPGGGGNLGTIKLDFNTDLFENKVVKLSRDTTGKLVVEAIQGAE
jgi:hypothetical protein